MRCIPGVSSVQDFRVDLFVELPTFVASDHGIPQVRTVALAPGGPGPLVIQKPIAHVHAIKHRNTGRHSATPPSSAGRRLCDKPGHHLQDRIFTARQHKAVAKPTREFGGSDR